MHRKIRIEFGLPLDKPLAAMQPWFLWRLGVHENFWAPYHLGDA
jgi:hypothetical protein